MVCRERHDDQNSDVLVAAASAGYDALRSRVSLLKREKSQVLHAQRAAHEAESFALLQQRQQHEAAMEQMQQEVAKLQLQLRQNTERSTKLRLHHEKERKVMAAQVEQLTRSLEGVHAEEAAKREAAAAQHAEAMAVAVQQAQQAEDMQAQQMLQMQRQHEAALDDVDGWCQGEVEAVRHQAAGRLHQAQDEMNAWRTQCQDESTGRQEAEAACQTLKSQLNQAQSQLASTALQLHSAQQQGRALQQELQDTKQGCADRLQQQTAAHSAEVLALKGRHHQDLDKLMQRLQAALATKDRTIACLNDELQASHAKEQRFAQLLSGQ